MSFRSRSVEFSASLACVLTLVVLSPAPLSGQAPPPSSSAQAGPSVTLPAGHPPVGGGSTPTPAAAQLPAGHPPMATKPSAPAFELPPVAPGSGTGVAALAWTPPADWVSQPPANPMRRAQYRVPGPAGEGECVVFYFGPGQGGDPKSNIERWADQFVTADGKPGTTAMQTRELAVGEIEVQVVETKGTYMAGGKMSGMAKSVPGQALLGAVAEGPDARTGSLR